MIVVDTSAFVSLGIAGVLRIVIDEYDVHTTQEVVGELETTAEYDDVHGAGADRALDGSQAVTVHDIDGLEMQASRIDAGEATCVRVTQTFDAAFLVTDDLRALPELQPLTDARVVISPVLLRALVKRGVLTDEAARNRLDDLAESRDRLGAPIYRRARRLFDDE